MKDENHSIRERLDRYLLGSRPHHALILAGPDAAAKEVLVKEMAAKLLQKHSPKTSLHIAERVQKEVHPDVIWVKEEGEDSIKIDRVREVCHQMEIAPLEAEAKICIIQDCHRMNSASANAFLKTLEEPLPNRFFWLMTSQIGSLLPTMLSRCLVFIFPPDEKKEATLVDANMWAAFQEGWNSGNFEAFTESLKDKSEAVVFLKALQEALRNSVLQAVVPEKAGMLAIPKISALEAIRKYETVVRLESQLRSNANYSLLMESALASLRQGTVPA